MSKKPSLRDKMRDDAISHTIWYFTGEKLLELIEQHWRMALGALFASAMTSALAYIKGLSRFQLGMIGMGTFVLVLFFWDLVIARQKAKVAGVKTSENEPFVEKLDEIRFDYPGSPMDRWEFTSDNPENQTPPVFSSPATRVGGLTMTAPSSHHIDLKLDPHQKVCNRIRFDMKLTRDSSDSYVYIKVQMTSKYGKAVFKRGWIACDVGNKPASRHGPDEWIIYGKPSADGWTRFDLVLPEQVRDSAFGQEEGFEFSELLSIRIRGSVSVSTFSLYS
jgi:hypothetical protein